MTNFTVIGEALRYIDGELCGELDLRSLSERFCFSAYYFHRLFSAVVGKPLAAYVRDRRILHAAELLSVSDRSVLDIALDSGFDSAQAFSRAFKEAQGLTPSEYRRQGYRPVIPTADELIQKFTNRLKGGIIVNPNIIKQKKLMLAGTCGDGQDTAKVWGALEKLTGEKPLANLASQSGYEVRCFDGTHETVFTGYCVKDSAVDPAYKTLTLPAASYASFEVYVAKGYESENEAMNQWLEENRASYKQKTLDGSLYCVEYYDERFDGSDNAIVEIWLPVEEV